METNNVTSGTSAAASANAGTSSNAAAVLSSDFETFLRMMTTQMKNQDPLNPVDATDYATQLATFSSVEQQVLTNDLLKGLTEQLTGNMFQQLSSWIGMETLADAPVFFDGSPIALRPDYAAGSDSARLLVTNAEGEMVQQFDMDMSEPLLYWTGVDDEGNYLGPGKYSFEIVSFGGEKELGRAGAQVYNPIIEARQENGSVVLTLSDGSEIGVDEVTALRAGNG